MSSSGLDLSPPAPVPLSSLPRLARFNVAAGAALVAALTLLLFSHWQENPDLSHGFLTPLVFILLLREARAGTPRWLPRSPLVHVSSLALFLAGLLALAAGGLYAAVVDWSHALVAAALTGATVALLAAALLVFASVSVRLIPLNWPAIVALLVWLLSAPIPPGTYTRLTLALQLWVTENVLRSLHLLGIAAVRHGNIIDLATASVGVEDACSGVRSLVSCVFAGLVFSAMLVRAPWARAFLIAAAAPLAIAMNFVRSLLLTLLANAGVDIAGTWHDVTGFGVLAVTALALATLATLLERFSSKSAPASAALTAAPAPALTGRISHAPLATGFAFVIALAAFFYLNTRPSERAAAPVPDLAAILPETLPGWRVDTSRDLFQFSDTLRTEHLAQRTYVRPAPDGVDQITIYLAYWRPGQAPVSLVASHTPDACWPGSGWTAVPSANTRDTLALPSRSLATAEARFFKNGQFPQHVWFWHLHDGRPIRYNDPYSPRELLAIALRYGFTHEGDQLFVRVSSNRPWPELANEPLLAEVFSRLQPLGL